MEFFRKAKSVRLRSHHDKFLLADDDEESVCQDRKGTVRQAKWTVEFVEGADVVRLKSCYGKYLTASNVPFLMGMTGKKVLQTLPKRLDSSIEWEPIRDGVQVRLKTNYGNFLRANTGLPPWRNSVTHDIPHRSKTQDWILWEVDVIEIREQPTTLQVRDKKPDRKSEASVPEPDFPSSIGLHSPQSSKLEHDDSTPSSPVKAEGRMIYYKVVDEDGQTDETAEWLSFTFMGSRLEELVLKLEQETEIEDIIVCSQFIGKLYPLRLELPPNNAPMHVVVVPSSSRAARDVEVPGSLT